MPLKSIRNVLTTVALITALTIPVGATAFADDNTDVTQSEIQQSTTPVTQQIEQNADLIVPSELIEVSTDVLPIYYNSDLGTFNNLNDLMPKIIEAYKKLESKVTFTYTGDFTEFSKNFYKERDKALLQPGNDYLHGTVGGGEYSAVTSAGTSTITMSFKYLGTAVQEAFVTKQVEKIAKELKQTGMSDFEKVKAVNQYVTTHTVYSKTANTTPHHVYAFLNEGKAVCQAYALLTYRLLTEMGVEARYVVGDVGKEGHAWNSVKIDGVWYHLDTTWNDASFNGYDSLSNTGYNYFLVTTDYLKKSRTWNEADYPVATDNRYSAYHDIFMGIEHNGEIYYSSASDNYNLYKLNTKTGSGELLLARSVAFIAAHNDYIYYSDFGNNKYLTALNVITKETEVIAQEAVTQLQVIDGFLHYKVGTKAKIYELPLSTENQAVRDVELKIVALSEFSSKEALEAAREAYEILTDGQKVSVKNLDKLVNLETKYPANLAAAETVATEVAKYSEQPTRAELKAIIAQFDALTPAQQALVSNKNKVLTFKSVIASQNSAITAVEKQITALKATSKTYLADIAKVRTAFDALAAELQADVENIDVLQKVESDTSAAQDAFDLIEALVDDASVDAIIAARTAYNKVPKALQKYVTNLKDLTAKEKLGKNVIAAIEAIDKIDPKSPKFVSQVTAARKAYDKAGTEQEQVTNSAEFLEIEKQAKVYDQIAKLKPTSAKYIAEVTAAETAYKALGTLEGATKYVTNEEILTDAVKAIERAQVVVAQITALDGTSIVAIVAARKAYTDLDKASQKYVTNLKDLTAKEKLGKNVIAAIEAIDKIDPKSPKFVSQVTAARKAYDKLGTQEQSQVSNGEEFLAIEKQAVVYGQIAKLKPTSAKYIAEVTAAKAAYTALEGATQYVTNAKILTDAEEAIEPAQAVVAQIKALEGTSVAAIVAARTAYDALDKALQKSVSNFKALTAAEKAAAASLKVIKLIEDVKKLDVSTTTFNSKASAMKKAYVALTDTNKAFVTNVLDYTSLVALYEVKNAQKTRRWAEVSAATFETLQITGVTPDNLAKVADGFNALRAGTGTATVTEIQENVTKFISE